jgi:hypothetical protein
MAINTSVKSVFVAGSVGRFVSVVSLPGSKLASGTYFVTAAVGERGCKGNTVLTFRNNHEAVSIGWREAVDAASDGACPAILSATILSTLPQISEFFNAPAAPSPLLASVEIGVEAPALNFAALTDTPSVEDIRALLPVD